MNILIKLMSIVSSRNCTAFKYKHAETNQHEPSGTESDQGSGGEQPLDKG